MFAVQVHKIRNSGNDILNNSVNKNKQFNERDKAAKIGERMSDFTRIDKNLDAYGKWSTQNIKNIL